MPRNEKQKSSHNRHKWGQMVALIDTFTPIERADDCKGLIKRKKRTKSFLDKILLYFDKISPRHEGY